MSWDTYVHQVCNEYDPDRNAWAVTNVCQAACVYGHDGALWATSSGFRLGTYEFEQTQEDGSKKKVICNEHAACMKATRGDRKGGQECGIRISNQKYMMLRNDEKGKVKFAILSRQGGGGACVAKTTKALIVGIWYQDKEGSAPSRACASMSNGGQQNTGDCEKLVMRVAC